MPGPYMKHYGGAAICADAEAPDENGGLVPARQNRPSLRRTDLWRRRWDGVAQTRRGYAEPIHSQAREVGPYIPRAATKEKRPRKGDVLLWLKIAILAK